MNGFARAPDSATRWRTHLGAGPGRREAARSRLAGSALADTVRPRP